MDLSAFYDECQSLPANERQWVDAFFHTVIDTFGEDPQNFADLQKVCLLFYGKRASLSKAQYYRKRNLIRRLYHWLAVHEAVDDDFVQKVETLKLQDVVSDSELYRYYFKDLDEVLDFVRVVGLSKGLGEYDDLLNVKTIIILTWHQVGLSEMVALHKHDLRDDSCSIIAGAKQIQLQPKYFEILQRFAVLDRHKGFPSQKQQDYMSSPFLIRSARQEMLNADSVHKVLRRFNNVSVEHGKELSILNLRRNGVFDQVNKSTNDKSANARIQELLGCDTAFAFGYKEFYERWKQLIAGGDGT